MLQIRLSRIPAAEGGSGVKPLPAESVTVACPDHLVLADLPVAKAIGSATAASLVKSVGRRSRRQLGERVHFCVRCDYPIAIYGRLSPCEHAFCLDCARSVSICYLCDERIQKIQTVKMMEGIFICAAPHCLKSFMKRTEFEFHIHENHADLLQSNPVKDDGNESEVQSYKQSTASDSTVRGPLRQVFSPGSNTQHLDWDEKLQHQQSRDHSWSATLPKQPSSFGQPQHNLSDSLLDNSLPQTLDRLDGQNRFLQQNFETQGAYQETGLLLDKQQGILPEPPISEYPPMQTNQPPSFVVPMTSNLMLTPPLPFGYPPYPAEGSQQFYSAPYEVARQDSAPPQVGPEQGSLLGFPPSVGTSFSGGYQQPWNAVKVIPPFEPSAGGHGISDGLDDSHMKGGFYQAEYGRHPGSFQLNASTSPTVNKGLEPGQSGSVMDHRDGKGVLAPQPMPFSARPHPPQPHSLQHMRGKFYAGEMGHSGQGYGWQHENNGTYGGGSDSRN